MTSVTLETGTDLDQASCKAAPNATTNGVSKAAAVLVGASLSRVSVPVESLIIGRLFQMPQVSYIRIYKPASE